MYYTNILYLELVSGKRSKIRNKIGRTATNLSILIAALCDQFLSRGPRANMCISIFTIQQDMESSVIVSDKAMCVVLVDILE